MGDVVVTSADREAALAALFGDDWHDMGPSWREYAQGTQPQCGGNVLHVTPEGVALAFARVRITAERAGYERGVREERERCALECEMMAGIEEGCHPNRIERGMAASVTLKRAANALREGEHDDREFMAERARGMREHAKESA